MRLQLLLFLFFVRASCDKLSKEENAARLKQCGKTVNSKIYNAWIDNSNPVKSPWTVALETKKTFPNGKKGFKMCTGTVISPRHVITASHCVLDVDQGKGSLPQKWTFTAIGANGKDFRPGCNGKDLYLDNGTVVSETRFMNSLIVRGKDESLATAKRFWSLSVCVGPKPIGEVMDMTLIELDRDLQFGPTLNMACVSNSDEHTSAGTKLDFYGYGSNPVVPGVLKGDGSTYTRVLGYEETQIKKEKNTSFYAISADRSTIAHPGDSGGGATRVVDGQTTLVGVISIGAGGIPTKKSFEFFMKVSTQSEKICEYTGICTPRKEPKRVEKSKRVEKNNRSTVSSYVSAFLLLVLFYLAH